MSSAAERKGKGSGKKRKTKSGLPEVSWKEAVLAYQISSKEKLLEDAKYELKTLDDQNMHHKDRNEWLKLEQTKVMNNLLRESKEFGKRQRNADVTTGDDVIAQKFKNWEQRKKCQKEIADMQASIDDKEKELSSAEQEVGYWIDYRERGQQEQLKQISLLQQELIDMQLMFEEMSEHMKNSLMKTSEEIQAVATKLLDSQKFLATEKAVAKLDKYSRREVIDNDWLHNETERHRRETSNLLSEVEKLEEGNLVLLSQLFECQVEDLQISKSFFMTQMDTDDLSKTSRHEIDLSRISLVPRIDISSPAERKSLMQRRPRSAIHKAVEDKLLALVPVQIQVDEEEAKEDEALTPGRAEERRGKYVKSRENLSYNSQPAAGIGRRDDEDEDENDARFDYFHCDGDDFEEYLRLGPLQLKTLNVSGHAMKIIKPPSPSDDELRSSLFERGNGRGTDDEWPITRSMLIDSLERGKLASARV